MRNATKEEIESIDAYINSISETMIPLSVLQEIRQEIAEYGSICVEYVAKNRGERDIELLIEDVLRQAKEQVLEIIDTHISALRGKDK